MAYHEDDVQAGQYLIKAPDQKVKRKSKKIAAPPAQDHQYTPGYGDAFHNTHHQQYNNINTGHARYDAYPYEEADDQITGTPGEYSHAYRVNPENYAYAYGQGAEFIGTDQHNEAGELYSNSNGVFDHTGGDQSNGGAHRHRYAANSETSYSDASVYGISKQPSDYKSYNAELGHGDYDQIPGIGEGNGVVAEPKKKKKKEKKRPKDGVSSHDELQQVDRNGHSERAQYNQQPSDAATLFLYGSEQGYGDSRQAGVEESGNGVVAAPDHSADQKKKKGKQKPKDHLQQADGSAHLESPRYNPPSDAAGCAYGAEQGYGDSQQVGVEESGNERVAVAPEHHNAVQSKIKIKNTSRNPKDGSTPTSHSNSDQPMIQDAVDGSRSYHQVGSHHGRGYHDKSNAPPRLDPLAEHIRKSSGPKPSYQDVSMVVFDPRDQSTSLVDPGRFTNESHVAGPRSRNPIPKPTKTQNGNSTTNSTKNMGKDDQRVFRDPLDEYLKQNQGNFSGLPGESMVVFDPHDQSMVGLPGTYNQHPSGPPNYNQLPAGQYKSNTRPRRVMSQQPTYHEQQHQNMIIPQQPEAVWGSPPHHHHHHQYQHVDGIAQGGHQSVAVQAGQPNEKVMKCIHTVGVPCATIATRIAMRQCLHGSCCCTIL